MDSNTRADQSEELVLASAELSFANRGCCCFWVPWPGTKSWERIAPAEAAPIKRRCWWTAGWRTLMKVREWSEMLAGPRWKTFIRRVRRYARRGGSGGGLPRSRFGYDPLSYSLNFDDGMDSETDDDVAHRGFSARYVAPPLSTKSSMDLGGRDASPLFVESSAAS
uniref:Uncharacterized protein LOC105050685 n=1 Tax=Elaeis guineensis var. tenera TaxID=51953 RepID=A0A6I9RN56_ELAGV|nr:uncharacterized protein LOC105050685 [Elaeis guineensis]